MNYKKVPLYQFQSYMEANQWIEAMLPVFEKQMERGFDPLTYINAVKGLSRRHKSDPPDDGLPF